MRAEVIRLRPEHRLLLTNLLHVPQRPKQNQTLVPKPDQAAGCGSLIPATVGSDWVFGQRCPVEFHL